MPAMPEFKDEQKRRELITANADYFTVVWTGGGNRKAEVPTLGAARQAANGIIEKHPDARLMIYGVYGSSGHLD